MVAVGDGRRTRHRVRLPGAVAPDNLASGLRRPPCPRATRYQTLGQFATLSPNAVMTRYGAATRHAHALVTGQDNEPLRPVAPPLAAQVTTTFEWEETDLDRLTFTLRTLAGQLIARLRTLAYPEGEMRDDLADSGEQSDPAFDPCAPDPLPDEEFANADSGDDETAPSPTTAGEKVGSGKHQPATTGIARSPGPIRRRGVACHLAPGTEARTGDRG